MYIIYQQLFFSSNNYINFKLIININNYYHSQSRFLQIKNAGWKIGRFIC